MRDWADQSSWSPASFATAAVVARSATARWARRVGSWASDGNASTPRSAQSRSPGGRLGGAAVGLHGVGAEHARRWRPASRVARTAAPAPCRRRRPRSPGPPARGATRPRRRPAPARRRRVRGRVVDAEQPHRGAPPRRRSAPARPGRRRRFGCSSVEIVWVVTRAGPTPGSSSRDAQQCRSTALPSGSMPPLSRTTGAVLAGAPAGTDSSVRRTAASETASAYSGPAAAAIDSMVSTPSIRVRVTASCSSRRGANRHSGGGRSRRRARGGAPVGTCAARLDSTVTPRSVTHGLRRCRPSGGCPGGPCQARCSQSSAAARPSDGNARTSPGTAHANIDRPSRIHAWSVTRAMRSQAFQSRDAHLHVLPHCAALHPVEVAGELQQHPDAAAPALAASSAGASTPV